MNCCGQQQLVSTAVPLDDLDIIACGLNKMSTALQIFILIQSDHTHNIKQLRALFPGSKASEGSDDDDQHSDSDQDRVGFVTRRLHAGEAFDDAHVHACCCYDHNTQYLGNGKICLRRWSNYEHT